jgi:hypothetical protein
MSSSVIKPTFINPSKIPTVSDCMMLVIGSFHYSASGTLSVVSGILKSNDAHQPIEFVLDQSDEAHPMHVCSFRRGDRFVVDLVWNGDEFTGEWKLTYHSGYVAEGMLSVGDIVETDEGFTCNPKRESEVYVHPETGELCIGCDDGHHNLTGQLEDGVYIGVYLRKEKVPPKSKDDYSDAGFPEEEILNLGMSQAEIEDAVPLKTPEEILAEDDAPELSKEWFANAELKHGDEVIRPSSRASKGEVIDQPVREDALTFRPDLRSPDLDEVTDLQPALYDEKNQYPLEVEIVRTTIAGGVATMAIVITPTDVQADPVVGLIKLSTAEFAHLKDLKKFNAFVDGFTGLWYIATPKQEETHKPTAVPDRNGCIDTLGIRSGF